MYLLSFSEKKINPRNTEQTEFFNFSARNSIYFVEQKTLEIPFRTITRKRKNARNSVPNNSSKEKKVMNFVLNHTAKENVRNSNPNH